LFGNIFIWCSLIVNLCSIILLGIGLKRKNNKIIRIGRIGIPVSSIFCTLSICILLLALIVNDFSFRYVAQSSNQNQPIIYRITALWGGMSGSLLFWLWLLAIFSALLVLINRTNSCRSLANHALFFLAIIQLFFNILVTGLISGVHSPFSRIDGMIDGQGMNPLLQTPSMVFHPPILYIGLIGFSVPFAFAIGALTSGKIRLDWQKRVQNWAIFSWSALTLGIFLGGVWAYSELGWGGYWSWDAVENVSLISWLLATAFLHSTIFKKKHFIVWNYISITLLFESTIFGAFITRSGIISSVHAFARSAIGYYFLIFMIISSLGVLALIIYRWKTIKLSKNKSEVKIFSPTGISIITNWLLLAMAFVVFLGTIFPIVSRLLTGNEMVVSEDYFNRVTRPLGLGFLVVICVKTLLSQKKNTMFVTLLLSSSFTIVTFVICIQKGLKLFALKNVYLLICSFAFFFLITNMIIELYKISQKRKEITGQNHLSAVMTSLKRNKKRFGGYISHIGITIIAIAILGSKGYQKSTVEYIKESESINIEEFTLRFDRAFEQSKSNFNLVGVEIAVMKSGKMIDRLYPAMRFYKNTAYSTPTKEIAFRRRLLADLYVAFTGITEDESIILHVYYTPLVNFLWLGCIVVLLGGLMILSYTEQLKEYKLFKH